MFPKLMKEELMLQGNKKKGKKKKLRRGEWKVGKHLDFCFVRCLLWKQSAQF